MTGGSTDVVKVVSQADVDSAKQKLLDGKDEAKQELQKSIEEAGLYAITDSFSAGKATTTSTPKVGAQGDSVNVTSTVTYKMLGVKEDDLKKTIDEAVKTEIDTNKQAVQDYGLGQAAFTINGKSGNQTRVSMQTTIAIGPKLDQEDIKRRAAGKKRGEIQKDIGNEPGIKEVSVRYSPFWVYRTPNNLGKITVVVESVNEQQTP